MGDRWTLELRCDWCGEMNDDVWYAPDSGSHSFGCKSCHKLNQIVLDFKAVKPSQENNLDRSTENG